MISKKMTKPSRAGKLAAALVALLLVGLFGQASDAAAGPIAPLATDTTKASLTAGYAFQGTLSSVYSVPSLFSGVLTSSIYWNVGTSETLALYELEDRVGPIDLNKLEITDLSAIPNLDAATLTTGGYLTGGPPPTLPALDSIVGTSGILNIIAFKWTNSVPLTPETILGTNPAGLFVKYDGLRPFDTYTGVVTGVVGGSVAVDALAVQTPEPGTMLLLGIGMVGIARRFRKRTARQMSS